MGNKSKGYFRIIPKAGKLYLIKVKCMREGNKVKQKFLCHIGSLEEIRKVVCSVQK